MRIALGSILLLAILSACSGGRDVHGSERFLRLTEEGFEIFENRDLTSRDFGTLVHKGGGDYEISQGSLSLSSLDVFGRPGAFIVPDVSEDQYLLFETIGDDTRFFVSSSDNIDLSTARLGRPYARYPETTASLRVDVSNLAAWSDGDELELTAPHLDVVLDLSAVRTGTPARDATSASMTYNFVDLGLPLLDAARGGDRFFLTQLEEKIEGDNSWLAATRAREDAVTMADGQTSTTSGALEEVAQNGSFHADVRSSAIEGLRTSVHEGAVFRGGIVDIGSLFAGKKHGYHSQPGTLCRFFLPTTPTDFIVDVTFGDPFPDTWDDLAAVDFVYTVPIAGLGATKTATLALTVGWVDTLEGARTGNIEPRMTPVRNVTIEGNDARQDLAGVSNQPLIRWSAPEKGSAHTYRLVLYAVQTRTDGTTAFSRFVEINTEDTGFQFPSGTIPSGPLYHLAITAYDEASRDIDTAPFRLQLPAAHATMLTAAFVP